MKYDVCVFGGCALDQMYYLDQNGQISRQPNILIPGGKGSNQAVAASRAGAITTIITRIGKDSVGENILENLIYNNVSTNNVEMIEGIDNDYAKIYIDARTKENKIERHVGATESFDVNMISTYQDVLLNSKIVVGQMKIPKEVSVALIDFCYEHHIPLIITPCRPEKLSILEKENQELLYKITYITANKKECETIFHTENIEQCVEKYPNKLIVTLGENGLIYNNGERNIHIDAIHTPHIEDTTGAGDTFCGNLAYCLSHGYSLEDAIVRSQYASAMKITKKTVQEGMPYKEELDQFLAQQ